MTRHYAALCPILYAWILGAAELIGWFKPYPNDKLQGVIILEL